MFVLTCNWFFYLDHHHRIIQPQGAGPNAQGIDVGNQGQYAPTSMLGGVLMQPRPTGVAPQPVPVGAPADPLQGYATDDEETTKLWAGRGGRAGGWTTKSSKRRALEEAFGSIWMQEPFSSIRMWTWPEEEFSFLVIGSRLLLWCDTVWSCWILSEVRFRIIANPFKLIQRWWCLLKEHFFLIHM